MINALDYFRWPEISQSLNVNPDNEQKTGSNNKGYSTVCFIRPVIIQINTVCVLYVTYSNYSLIFKL